MTTLTKTEIGRAVTALRELTDIIERIEKATWPESQSDVLRKADVEPSRASGDDIAKRALDLLADAERRMTALEASRDIEAQFTPRKTYRDTAN